MMAFSALAFAAWMSSTAHMPASWRRAAFAGITWHRVAAVLALCAAWTLSVSTSDFSDALQDGAVLDWLLRDVLAGFASSVVIATVMAGPLVAVGNLGPQSGWKRIAALALAIVMVAPLATLVREHYVVWASGGEGNGDKLRVFLVLWLRYVQLTAMVTVVFEFYRRERRSVESMHRAEIDRLALDREMDEARLQVLQAQIEPHFLFNTLANVRRLYQTDHNGGREMLRNLMRYLEIALPHMRQDRSTVGRELTLIESYLNVQRIRMGSRLSYAIDVPPDLLGLELSPMMLLTLVENAVKHGLGPLPEGGMIKIVARREGEALRIDVADSGRGFHAASGGGTGLANIRARLEAMFGAAASLSLVENLPRGVTSTLRVPLRLHPGAAS